ncbi:MAG: hypothetical protein QG585_620 [Patescibacteria group bacterium]|nr:hypothetical protein [Patescibacteria group bacterium]
MKADIFFFITTVAVVVFSLLGAIMLFYGIKIARDIQKIAEIARRESEEIIKDIDDVRGAFKQKVVSLIGILSSIGLFRKKKRSKSKKEEEEI